MRVIEWIQKNTVLFLFVIAFLLYTPSLFGKFVWDDEDFVYANTYVQTFQIGRFFTENAIAGRGKESNYYRPIQQTFYAIEYKIVKHSPFFYHLNNNLLHAGGSAVLYLVLLKAGVPYITALFSILFFIIHPIQTESVSYVSGRSDMLYVLFLSLSAFFFLKKRTSDMWFSILFFLLALLSKETALTGLVFLPASLWLRTKKMLPSVKKIIPFFLIAAIYLILRFTILEFQSSSEAWGDTPYATNIIVRISTFFRSYFTYLRLLFLPYDLHMERDLTTPIAHSIFTWWTVLFFSLQAVVSLFGFQLYRIKERIGSIWIFGYVLFSFCMAFYSGVVLLNGIFYEHYLYFALLFFFLLIVSGIFFFLPKRLAVLLLAVYLFILAVINIRHQFVWITPIQFYTHTLSYAPDSLRIRNGLAMAYADAHELDKAIVEYKKIIQKGNTVSNIYHNLANAYVAKRNYTLAEKYYIKAITTQKSFHFSYTALVNMYIQTKNIKKLTATLPMLEHMGIGYVEALRAIAVGYEHIGDEEKARMYYEICCGIKTQ